MRVFYNNNTYNAVGYSFTMAPYFDVPWTNTILKVGSPLGAEYLVNGGGWDLRPAAIQNPAHSYYTPPVATFHNYFGDNYPYSTWGENENRGDPGRANPGRFMSEGDNPAFWFIQDVGLRGGVENPGWGGWGGRFFRDPARANNEYTDSATYNAETIIPGIPGTTGRFQLQRWLPDMQSDFSCRVQWGITPKYEDANHNPLSGVLNGLDIDARPGDTIDFNGVAYDPDGDVLSYRWYRYAEVDTYGGNPNTNQGKGTFQLANTKDFTYTVPADAKVGDTIHLIFEVSDAPSNPGAYEYMVAYKRVVITIAPVAEAWPVVAAEAYIDKPVEYSIKLKANEVLPNANAFAVTVTVDKLGYSDFEAPDGFRLLKGPSWLEQEDGSWQGTFMFYTFGNGVNLDGESTLLKLYFNAVDAGSATLILDEVYLTTQGSASEMTKKTFAVISETNRKAVTEIIGIPDFLEVYSIYDLNKDEVVDLLDISIALRAFLIANDDEEWNIGISSDKLGVAITAALCDVNGDGVVDMLDIADILAHFGPAPIQYIDPRI